MILEIKLKKEDIKEFCDVCTQLKNKGVYVEVYQDSKVISGSSIIGLTLIDFERSVHIITRVKIERDVIKKLNRWIV